MRETPDGRRCSSVIRIGVGPEAARDAETYGRLRMKRWLSLTLVVSTIVALPFASPAAAASRALPPQVTTRGVHFVGAGGRSVILRGVDISPASPNRHLVVEVGANFVRMRILWATVEPQAGTIDSRELATIASAVDYYADHHIYVELDLRGKPAPLWFGSTVGFFYRNAAASQAAYLGFVRPFVRRFDRNPYVVGYGIFNEPEPYSWCGVGYPLLDRHILAWQAGIRRGIRAIDPYRAIFVNIRGGNYGVQTSFRKAGFGLAHTVLDWHDFYNGRYGSGLDATDDNWVPSWPETHNQRTTPYEGTRAAQWQNLAIPWERTHRLGIPMIVGEWGIRIDDANRMTYDRQMQRLFDAHGLSWARWSMDSHKLGLIHHGALNDQGQWLQQALRAAP
jgi:cellulase (glycosyl hydrolase family 5)